METHFIIISKWMLCMAILQGFVHGVKTNKVVVETPVGTIAGTESEVKVKLNSNISYSVRTFFGIPYAEAPIGNLRFRKPVRKANFNSEFDATEEGPVCYQIEGPIRSTFVRSEDCLRLNIYVPMTTNSDVKKPVMVWIHGGGFVHGENYAYNGTILSAFGDVIVVTVNYRLAYLGFYSTDDSDSPGNYGLWDQQMAIKWTSENIEAFGGDPDQMTLFGGSSGASSVLYQAFYPGNKGLFKRVIAQSGTMLSPWAFRQSSHNAQLSKNFADALECSGSTSTENTECLRGKTVAVLNRVMNNATINAELEPRTPGPVLDNKFILDGPANLINGNSLATAALEMFASVDVMIGYNGADGMVDFFSWMIVVDCQDNDPYNFHLPENIFAWKMVPHYVYQFFKSDIPDIAVMVATDEYSDWSEEYDERLRITKLIELATDYYVAVSTVQTALKHVSVSSGLTSTYAYEFAVRPSQVKFLLPPIIDGPEVMTHGDEIGFVFGMKVQDVSDDANLVSQYNTYLATMTMWTNFAKTGNPNTPSDVSKYRNSDVTWPAFTTDNRNYLRITPIMSPESAKTNMKSRAIDFWTKVLPSVVNHFNTYDPEEEI